MQPILFLTFFYLVVGPILMHYLVYLSGLNMFLLPINIPTFRFSHSKIFLQLLVPQKFSITTFGPYF